MGGPDGVYDPAIARVAAERTLSYTKKILALNPKPDHQTWNTMTRYIMGKNYAAVQAKEALLYLWANYFKPVHLRNIQTCMTLFGKQSNCAPLALWKLTLSMRLI